MVAAAVGFVEVVVVVVAVVVVAVVFVHKLLVPIVGLAIVVGRTVAVHHFP